MTSRRRHGSRLRTALVVVALYAVLLQGFLAGLNVHFASDPIAGVLCLTSGGQGDPDGRQAQHHEACCLVACAAATAAVPTATAAVHAPRRIAATISFPEFAAFAGQRRPSRAFGARGPPSAA